MVKGLPNKNTLRIAKITQVEAAATIIKKNRGPPWPRTREANIEIRLKPNYILILRKQ